MQEHNITFDGKPIDVKFDNYTIFKFACEGLSMASLLICKGNSPENFSKAWSIILGVEFDGDTRAFFDRFKFKKSISSLNEFLISTLERDGVIEPEDKKSGSKKNAMT